MDNEESKEFYDWRSSKVQELKQSGRNRECSAFKQNTASHANTWAAACRVYENKLQKLKAESSAQRDALVRTAELLSEISNTTNVLAIDLIEDLKQEAAKGARDAFEALSNKELD